MRNPFKSTPSPEDLESEQINQTLSAIFELGKERADDIYSYDGAEDYTAGLYSYAYMVGAIYTRDMALGCFQLFNAALRDALKPLLIDPEFDFPAWNSVVNTSAAWLLVDYIRGFPPNQRAYILSWAPRFSGLPQGAHAAVAAMYDEFETMAKESPDDIIAYAARSVVRSATDGAVSMNDYDTGQNWEVPAECWTKAVDLYRDQMLEHGELSDLLQGMELAAEQFEPG